MMTRDGILNAIQQVIEDLNSERDAGVRIHYEESLVLLGIKSPLDSLGFVNFVVGLEEHLRSDYGFDIDLTALVVDETANQPFRSVSALADYLVSAGSSEA